MTNLTLHANDPRVVLLRQRCAQQRKAALGRSCVPYGVRTVPEVPAAMLPSDGGSTWAGDTAEAQFALGDWDGYLMRSLLPPAPRWEDWRWRTSRVGLGERPKVGRSVRYADTRKPNKAKRAALDGLAGWDRVRAYADLLAAQPRQWNTGRQLATGLARLGRPRYGTSEVRVGDSVYALPLPPHGVPTARPTACLPSTTDGREPCLVHPTWTGTTADGQTVSAYQDMRDCPLCAPVPDVAYARAAGEEEWRLFDRSTGEYLVLEDASVTVHPGDWRDGKAIEVRRVRYPVPTGDYR